MSFELTVDRDMQGTPHPYLSSATRKASDAQRPLTLTMDNWRRYEDEQGSIRVSQKTIDLLGILASRSKTPGQIVEINFETDYPLIAAADEVELQYYITHLSQRGLITGDKGKWALTLNGWEAIEPLPKKGGIPGQCFIAMWFSDEMQEAFETGIVPAVREAGFRPVRIDQKEHNNEITDEIMAEIRNCQFMVADFTGQRTGVYYEAGFAVGLGRPVIWCCKKNEIGNLHFDTNHRNHIDWQAPADLRDRLYKRIRATILDQS